MDPVIEYVLYAPDTGSFAANRIPSRTRRSHVSSHYHLGIVMARLARGQTPFTLLTKRVTIISIVAAPLLVLLNFLIKGYACGHHFGEGWSRRRSGGVPGYRGRKPHRGKWIVVEANITRGG